MNYFSYLPFDLITIINDKILYSKNINLHINFSIFDYVYTLLNIKSGMYLSYELSSISDFFPEYIIEHPVEVLNYPISYIDPYIKRIENKYKNLKGYEEYNVWDEKESFKKTFLIDHPEIRYAYAKFIKDIIFILIKNQKFLMIEVLMSYFYPKYYEKIKHKYRPEHNYWDFEYLLYLYRIDPPEIPEITDDEFVIYFNEMHSVEPNLIINFENSKLIEVFKNNLVSQSEEHSSSINKHNTYAKFKYIVDNISILFKITNLNSLDFIINYLNLHVLSRKIDNPENYRFFPYKGPHTLLHYIQNSKIRYEYKSLFNLSTLLNELDRYSSDTDLISFFINDGLYLAKPEVLRLVTKNGTNINTILELISIKDLEALKWIQSSILRMNWEDYKFIIMNLLLDHYLNNKEGTTFTFILIKNIYEFLILDGVPFTEQDLNRVYSKLDQMKKMLSNTNNFTEVQMSEYLESLSDLVFKNNGVNMGLILDLILLKNFKEIKEIQNSKLRINWKLYKTVATDLISEYYLNNKKGTEGEYENIKDIYEFLISDGFPFNKLEIDIIHKQLNKMEKDLFGYNDIVDIDNDMLSEADIEYDNEDIEYDYDNEDIDYE
jgi:hypothetical protein